MDRNIAQRSPLGTPIIDSLLNLKMAFLAKECRIISITLDKAGNKALRNELCVPEACGKMILGIVIECAKECPTCGQDTWQDLKGRQ